MNPRRVDRSRLHKLTDLPNVGPAMARDLSSLGIRVPADLVGHDALELFETLCAKSRRRHDPCVLDTFMSITAFMNGHAPRPWWEYTAERKQRYGRMLEAARER